MKKPPDPKNIARGRKSSRKGKRRERIFAKELSLWWTGEKDSQSFRRTPQSGGFPKKRSHGDILPISPDAAMFPFVIDIKDRKNVEGVEFADLLSNEGCPLFKWFDELTQIIQENPVLHAGKLRLLIVHKKRKDYCIVGGKEYAYVTDNAGPIPYMKISHR